MHAWLTRVRLESSSPQLPQSLQAPQITLDALVMKSKYPGMGSTCGGGPASSPELAMAVAALDGGVEGGWGAAGDQAKRRDDGGEKIMYFQREGRDKQSPDGATNPSTC